MKFSLVDRWGLEWGMGYGVWGMGLHRIGGQLGTDREGHTLSSLIRKFGEMSISTLASNTICQAIVYYRLVLLNTIYTELCFNNYF